MKYKQNEFFVGKREFFFVGLIIDGLFFLSAPSMRRLSTTKTANSLGNLHSLAEFALALFECG